jgi:hypothetical protein
MEESFSATDSIKISSIEAEIEGETTGLFSGEPLKQEVV